VHVLVLEDCPGRRGEFGRWAAEVDDLHLVATVDAAIEALQHKHWDWVFLDYRLDGPLVDDPHMGTGYAVAQWLSMHPDYVPPHVVIHSADPMGADRMNEVLPDAIQACGCWVTPFVFIRNKYA